MPDAVGFTEGPETIRGLISQRARWQRVIMETVWHYRHMLCNPRYGTVGWLGMPYYLLGEVCAPVLQLIAIILVPVAAMAGLLQLADFLRLLAIIALTSGAFTAAVLFFQRRNMRPIATRYLPYMLALAPLDLFLYRPIIAWAQCKGVIGFFRGYRGWDKSSRNKRDN
jgi:biofilm PGA synthesis N-glycosyltransferase PgaC